MDIDNDRSFDILVNLRILLVCLIEFLHLYSSDPSQGVSRLVTTRLASYLTSLLRNDLQGCRGFYQPIIGVDGTTESGKRKANWSGFC